MALTTCTECKHSVSTTAKICPSCGYNLKQMTPFTKIMLIVFISFLTAPFWLHRITTPSIDSSYDNKNTTHPVKSKRNELDELCKDWIYNKAKIIKHTRNGDMKKAREAKMYFDAFTEDLSKYPEEDVYTTCKKYETKEFVAPYMR